MTAPRSRAQIESSEAHKRRWWAKHPKEWRMSHPMSAWGKNFHHARAEAERIKAIASERIQETYAKGE